MQLRRFTAAMGLSGVPSGPQAQGTGPASHAWYVRVEEVTNHRSPDETRVRRGPVSMS